MSVTFKSEAIQKHKDLSDKIKENLQVQNAAITEKEPHSAYYANLPEGVDQKHVEALTKYNSRFVTAAHVAVGELASDVFIQNPTVNEVTARIGFFGKTDEIDISASRQKLYQNHLAAEGEPKEITKHLVLKTTITSQSTKGYGLKSVREAMSEEFQGFSKL